MGVFYDNDGRQNRKDVKQMDKRLRFLSVFVVIATLIVLSSVVVAGDVSQVNERHLLPANAAMVSKAASKSAGVLGEPYGVAVTPAVYLVNFLLLYIANPNEAANMPAYRTTIPSALYDCLKENPEGCPYTDFARFFDDQVSHGGASFWPSDCQEDPKWEVMAPSVARHPDQINEPLGLIGRRGSLDS
jgi:hypothetical protein